jgi:N-acetylmuramoyl-L-alanine amidase
MNRLQNFAISILMLLLWSSSAFAKTEILNLRHWAAPDHTRVVIDTDDEVQFNVEKSKQSVLLNIENAILSKTMPREFLLNKPGIRKVVLYPLKTGNVRIELFLDKHVDTNIFKLKKFQDKPNRLVVDILLSDVEKEKSVAKEKGKVEQKDKIIVIDPGHGGEDPGARGRRGTREKDVVLDIGKKLKNALNAGEGVRAYLTREGDYYVPFKKRLGIARDLGADLFISIHADAAPNKAASGSSVYCLSTGGASSEAARILARKENMADSIGGVLGNGVNGDESDPIILDMYQNNTINKSKTFGANILGSLCTINNIKFSSVQEAPFRVLKLPDIPAILIETAYISNNQEERDLRDGGFQTKVAETIAGSVREFLRLPPIVEHVQEKSAKKLDRKDELKTSKLKGGKSSHAKTVPLVYKVKKGDTLAKIAVKYQTNIAALLKLNRMKFYDPLYVNRELKLPPPIPDKRDK